MYKPLDKADATFFELAQGDIVTAEIWNSLNRFYINQGNTVVDAVNILQTDIAHLEERYQHLGIYYGEGEAPSWAYLQIVPTGNEGLSLITWPYVVDRLEQTYALGKKTPEGGEIFNDYENNLAQGDMSHSEGYSTTASGHAAHAEGNCAKASGNSSHAEGVSSTASGGCSHAEGYNTMASGPYSHAEGYHTTASGSYSHAEGASTLASMHYSHAEGKSSTASDYCSHAEGEGTTASGYSSHAEGWSSTASGSCSHTEGSGTRAFGGNSHAEGDSTTASGARSHAEGFQTIAAGDNSHASGEGTIASGVDQTAVGKYNQENQEALFIVGNGKNESARSNAFEVLEDGSAVLQTTGTTPNSITTKQYVDSEIQSSVDVNYSPASARAQSGIAVAEATAQKPFELIEEITLSEDTQKIVRTIEPSGTPYNFKKIVVLITSPKTDEVITRTVYTRIYCGSEAPASYIAFTSNSKYFKRAAWRMQIENSELRYSTVDCTFVYGNAQNAQGGDSVTYKEKPTCNIVTDNISKIEIYCSSNEYVPAGFLIQVYGVRA